MREGKNEEGVLKSGEVSQHSLSMRFNTVTISVKENMLNYFTSIDYDTHFAIAAFVYEEGQWKGVATARFIEDNETPEVAEWAAIVLDKYHGLGIGSCLLYYLSVMASHFDIRRLVAIVHQENYPVLHWMKKLNAWREAQRDCHYWMFRTPISPEWISDEVSRDHLEKAACGLGHVDDDCMEELRCCVRKLKNPEFLYGREQSDQRVSLGKQEKRVERSAPTVSFVTSFEDELDIGDLF
ncbi:cyclic nucleotide-binding protein [Blastocystis sp. subtype 4]|uniref:cyclic nucleotide-binding protein n=1 Tax=Blastocystis sp. subtype 4 TaxID=944170 RepID=UPI000711D8CF|nr:cyclic nucleotide-binding protein [Blastocystis sp. subtype 4]KNB43742.1 cyclic nucleotide-binding protein [Blastocystis sp. subtype 4]|eukprot:XP_014527185.1 cyclic nucleotide-binding protein [Blastocystis sp. subtype 4]